MINDNKKTVIFLFLAAFFLLNIKNASATIIYSSITQGLSSSITTDGVNGWVNSANEVGNPDNIYASSSAMTSQIYTYQANYGASGLPTGAIIDSVIYSLHATGNFAGSQWIVVSATSRCINSRTYTATPTYFNYQIDSTNCPTYYNTHFNDILNGTNNAYITLARNTGTVSFQIDSMTRTIFYHYDNTLTSTRILSFSALPKGGSGAPWVFSATTTTNLAYYYNSTSDSATSTKYTLLQYKLYDFFTNTTIKANVPITTKDTNATSTLTNICVNTFGCVNGDTYQLSARYSNDDESIVSPYFPTYYYFAYIAYTPTPTATTSVIIIGNGFDTGTTTIDVNKLYVDCGITELEGCFKNALIWSFIPSSSSTAAYYNFTSTIGQKAPMGYFTILKNNLSGLNSTSSPAFSIIIPAHIKQYVFNPFDLAIAAILWFFFAINFYKRLKHITV